MNRYKTEILTVNEFVNERPDLAIHSELTIQSAIYSSATLLNSICNGLINEVWEYNTPDPDDNSIDSGMNAPDPSSPLYRTQFELDCIKEAFIQQTQYSINLGNDYTTGAISGSIGNVNYSSSRNDNQDKIAPAVLTLLQKARVYQINQLVNLRDAKLECDVFYDNVDKCDLEYLTYSTGDTRYVRQYQPNVKGKKFLTVDETNGFTTWEEIDATIPDGTLEQIEKNTNDINQLKLITDDTANTIENLVNSTNELNVKVEANTNEINEINSFLNSGYIIKFRGVYNADTQYSAYDYVWNNLDEKKTYFALKDSVGIPLTNTEYWVEQQISQDIELDNYYTKDEINNGVVEIDNRFKELENHNVNNPQYKFYGPNSNADSETGFTGNNDTTQLWIYKDAKNYSTLGGDAVGIKTETGLFGFSPHMMIMDENINDGKIADFIVSNGNVNAIGTFESRASESEFLSSDNNVLTPKWYVDREIAKITGSSNEFTYKWYKSDSPNDEATGYTTNIYGDSLVIYKQEDGKAKQTGQYNTNYAWFKNYLGEYGHYGDDGIEMGVENENTYKRTFYVSGSNGYVEANDYYKMYQYNSDGTEIPEQKLEELADNELPTTKQVIDYVKENSGSSGDLSNYYNKTEIDSKVSTIEMEINSNKDLIDNNTDDINKNMSAINEIKTEIQTINTSLDLANTQLKNIDDTLPNLLTKSEAASNYATLNQLATTNENLASVKSFIEDGNIIRFRGVYETTTEYKAYDYVWDNLTDKNTYFANKDSIGIPLSNTEFWTKTEISQNIDLSDYYTKSETDAKFSDVNNAINSNTNNIQVLIGRQNEMVGEINNRALNSELSETNKNLSDLTEQVSQISIANSLQWNSKSVLVNSTTSYTIKAQQGLLLNFSHPQEIVNLLNENWVITSLNAWYNQPALTFTVILYTKTRMSVWVSNISNTNITLAANYITLYYNLIKLGE